jgi:hypothetical protein
MILQTSHPPLVIYVFIETSGKLLLEGNTCSCDHIWIFVLLKKTQEFVIWGYEPIVKTCKRLCKQDLNVKGCRMIVLLLSLVVEF